MTTASALWLALGLLVAGPQEGWWKVEPGLALEFPRDHGAHPAHRTEWWYVTGNLEDRHGRRFGVQLTFFRSGLGPGGGPSSLRGSNRDSSADPIDDPAAAPREAGPRSLRPRDVWAGHLALVDVERGETRLAERLRRGSSSLVRSSDTGLDLALEDWVLRQGDDGTIRLLAADPTAGIALDLALTPTKPLVLHGEGGVSTKGFEPGNASAYTSWTRLSTEGTLAVDGRRFELAGQSWLDHEWGSGQLGEGVIGWDWFGLQLDDGRELMVYGLRRADGTSHPLSGGTLVERDGTARPLALEDFEIETLATWTSPRTGAVYPARWTIAVPDVGLRLVARPLVADCELDTASTDVVYWEGPVELIDSERGAPRGRGYAELVGHAHDMLGRF